MDHHEQGEVSFRVLGLGGLVLALMLLALLPLGSLSQALRTPPRVVFHSAERCAGCHADVHREWSQSFMAQSWRNPVFQLEFKRYLASQGAAADPEHPLRATCLRCHAPLAVMMGDLALRDPVSREGVSCEACHRAAMVKETPFGHRLVMDPDPHVQYGSKVAQNSFHATRKSAAIAGSQLCGGCHLDIDKGNGVALERTFQEWRSGHFGMKGLQCAACHMPAKASAGPSRLATHSSHRFHGGHTDSLLLKGAVSVTIEKDANRRLQVAVENLAVGHNFPTGGAHPSRAVLTVEVRDPRGKRVYAQDRVYGYGNDLSRATLRADQPLVDTTLKPLERRIELFPRALLREGYQVQATLRYKLLPAGYEKDLPSSFYATFYKPVLISEARYRW